MSDKKDKLSVTLPEDLVDILRVCAKRDHRSLSGQISFFLAQAVGQSMPTGDNVQHDDSESGRV